MKRTCSHISARTNAGTNMSLQHARLATKKRRDEVNAEPRELNKSLRMNDTTQGDASSLMRTTKGTHKPLLAPKPRDTAAVLFHTGDEGEQLCCQYLLHTARRTGAGTLDIPEIIKNIREIPPGTSVDLVHDVPGWIRRQKGAQKFIDEQRLHQWIQEENDQCGLAPTTRRVCSPRLGTPSDYTLPNCMPPVSTCTPIPKRMK